MYSWKSECSQEQTSRKHSHSDVRQRGRSLKLIQQSFEPVPLSDCHSTSASKTLESILPSHLPLLGFYSFFLLRVFMSSLVLKSCSHSNGNIKNSTIMKKQSDRDSRRGKEEKWEMRASGRRWSDELKHTIHSQTGYLVMSKDK